MSKKHKRYSRRKRSKIRNSLVVDYEPKFDATNIDAKPHESSDHRTTAADHSHILGGKHRSPPTGNRHRSKLADELLHQFANEHADHEEGFTQLQKYFASLKLCSLCGRMEQGIAGKTLHLRGMDRPQHHCSKCREKVLPARREPLSGQRQLF